VNDEVYCFTDEQIAQIEQGQEISRSDFRQRVAIEG
jgi:hypothetical protein